MAKNKKSRRGARGSRKKGVKSRTTAAVTTPASETVTMTTMFGEIQLPATFAPFMAREILTPSDEDFTILDLSGCEATIDFMSPGLVTCAFAEAEGLDPKVADQLVRSFSMLMPGLTIHGERALLMPAAATIRLIRSVELYSGDTHATLMGMVYGLPRIVLAQFENGPAAEAASEELVRMYESWDGRLLLLLDSSSEGRGTHYEVGHLFAAHQVDLRRPVLWHRGERPVS